jgi:hypothetical protein
MASTEYGPTAPLRIGTMIRKPLPKIDANGGAVAPGSFFILPLLL